MPEFQGIVKHVLNIFIFDFLSLRLGLVGKKGGGGVKELNPTSLWLQISHFRVSFCHCGKMSLCAKPFIQECVPLTGSFSCTT